MEVFRLTDIVNQGHEAIFPTPGTRFLVKNLPNPNTDDEYDILVGFGDGPNPYGGDTGSGLTNYTTIPMGGSEVIYDTAESGADCYDHSRVYIGFTSSYATCNVEVRKVC